MASEPTRQSAADARTAKDVAPAHGPEQDSINAVVGEIVERLRTLSSEPDAVLTCSMLIDVIGPRSHALAIFVFSLLNLLPAPPGYNFVMGLIITGFSIMMLLDRPMRLTGRLGRMRLPIGVITRLLGVLSWIADLVVRFSSPRWSALAGTVGTRIAGLIGAILGVVMLVPIPFTNMLPSIGLAVVCIGVLNRDGVLLVGGIVVGFVGIGVTALATWAVLALFFVAEDLVYDVLDG